MKTSIDQNLVDRVAGMTNQKTDWFSPMKPLPSVAPQAEGRMWDFPVGYNTRVQVRSGEAVGFGDMRALADAYDLLRLVIETRKDQLCKLDWQILPKKEGVELDEAGKAIQEFLNFPDKEHTWDDWLRMLLEDMLVLDAPTIYPRYTKGGDPYSLELIDGATIKRVIDFTGRTPVPPDPAYQQIIKGMPAVDYTREELYYRPRNPRTNRVYGYSPVEQILITVNIALRRQQYQMQYYTEGNIPEALIAVPATWTTSQITEFQNFWDSLVEGDTAQRRHAKFVPGDMKYQATKEPILKDEYDEWLARVVCFAFSISPQPFVKQMNRATAETALETALEEGLAPLMRWVIGTMNYILVMFFKRPDLRFEFKNSEVVDPKDQADIHGTYLDRKVLTPDEVRADLGRRPMTPEEREAAWPTPEQLNPDKDPDGSNKDSEEEESSDDKKVKKANDCHNPSNGKFCGGGSSSGKGWADGKQRLNGNGKVDPNGEYVEIPLAQMKGKEVREAYSNLYPSVSEAYGESKTLDPSTLRASQKTVNVERVNEYITNPKRVADTANGRDNSNRLLVMSINDQMVVVDGHHRVVADLAAGRKTKAWVVDMDTAMKEAKLYRKEHEGTGTGLAVMTVANARVKGALAKMGKLIDRDRATVQKTVTTIIGSIKPVLIKLRKSISDDLIEAYTLTQKVSDDDDIERILESVNLDPLTVLVTNDKTIMQALEQMAVDGGIEALLQVGITDITEDMLSLVNQYAVEYAKERAAELVGMKWVDGELVPNPQAKWSVTETTRKGIRTSVITAIEEGWSNDELAKALVDSYSFSEARAENIARTETAFADSAGNLKAYELSGMVKKKRWLLAQSDYCPICEANHKAEVIDLDATFPDGSKAAPAHPKCRCDILPVLEEND